MSTILNQSELAQIISDVRSILTDDTIGTSIYYHKFDSASALSSWSPTTGLLPVMYSISSVSVFKGSYNVQEIMQSGGLIEQGDIKFILMRDDVSGVLSVDDRIVESAKNYQSATTYEIRNIQRDPLAICNFIQARSL